MRLRTRVDARLPPGPRHAAQARTLAQSAGGFTHSLAGGAGDHRTATWLAALSARSGRVAAASTVSACIGGGDIHYWLRWRYRDHFHDLRRSRGAADYRRLFATAG